MKRKISALLAVCMLMTNIFDMMNVHAEENENNIFKTDFNSYTVGKGETVQADFTTSPYSLIVAKNEAAKIAGAQLDAEHGKSMRYSDGDWVMTSCDLPDKYTAPVLISLDLNFQKLGAVKILANNGENFALSFNGGNYIEGLNYEGTPTKENAIEKNRWHRVEVYVDSSNDKQITYIDGKQVGGVKALEGSKTPLESVQIQKINGDMYVDNFEIKQASQIPYLEDITASIPSNRIGSGKNSVHMSFSGEVDTKTITTENVKVYNIESGNYLSGVTLENITSTSVDIRFGENLAAGKSYRIDLANIIGTLGQRIAPAQIPFEVFEGDDSLIFKTDFSSYTIGMQDTVTQELKSLPYSIAEAKDSGDIISGAQLDEEHGNSMHFPVGDWVDADFNLPDGYSDPVLITFDLNFQQAGAVKLYGNDGTNFGLCINNTNYVENLEPNSPPKKENVIEIGRWHKVEIYVDSAKSMQITYIDGKQIGMIGKFDWGWGVTPLTQIQIYKISGDMYIDNMEVKQVTDIPYIEDTTASIPSNSISSENESMKLSFSNEVKPETVTTENIKVYDVENENYLSGVTLENITSTSVDIRFGEKLTVGQSYRIELANIIGTLGQPLKTTQIPFEVFEVNENLIFKTDFSSYALGTGDLVNFEFSSLPYAIAEATNEGDKIVGVQLDEEHGNSMRFGEGDWVMMSFNLGRQYPTPVLISLDLNFQQTGAVKILGNNGTNFGFTLNNTNYIEDLEPNSPPEKTNAIKIGRWHRVEIYIDSTERKQIVYIDGKQVGIKSNLDWGSGITPLQSIQIQKISGDMYIDNFNVELANELPHTKPIVSSLSLKDNIMPKGGKSLYLQFSDVINTATISDKNITVSEIIDDSSKNIPFTLSEITSRKVKLTFADELNEKASYRINLDSKIIGSGGNPLSTYHINFFPYSESLRVNNIEFAGYWGDVEDGMQISPEVRYITVYFNKPFDKDKINGNIMLTDENDAEIPSELKYIEGKNAVEIQLNQMLKGNSVYHLIVNEEILPNERKRTFTTSDGCFGKGTILVNGVKDKVSGIFEIDDSVTVKADIINTVCQSQNYEIMVGEYKNGKLCAYHFYNEKSDEKITLSQKEYTVKLLSQTDEIRAFVWESMKTEQGYASDFIISDIKDDYIFTIDGTANGENARLMLTANDISWDDVPEESIAGTDIAYFDECTIENGEYSFSCPLECKSGLYRLFVRDENNTILRDLTILYTNPSENVEALEKLTAEAKVSKDAMKKVTEDYRYELQFYMPLTEKVSENVAADAIYNAVTQNSAELSGTEIADIYRKNLVVDGLNEGKINNIDDYYAYLKFENANVDKWYNKADKASRDAIASAVMGKSLSSFEKLENKFIEAMILERVHHPDGYMNIVSILNDFQTKTGFPTAIINNTACSAVAGKKYESYSALRTALTEASEGSNNYGGGSGGGGGSGSSNKNTTTSVTLPSNPVDVVEPLTIKCFNDIDEYPWAKNAIEALYDKGIIDGKAEGIFAPADFVTREEFAKLIVLAMDLQNDSMEVSFDDVKDDAWYAPYVTSLVNSGTATGIGDNNFGIGMPISRQDMAVMIYRALGGNAEYYAEAEFGDMNDVSDYATPAIRFMSAMGYISGYEDGTFKPLNNISRAETAVVLYRVLGN